MLLCRYSSNHVLTNFISHLTYALYLCRYKRSIAHDTDSLYGLDNLIQQGHQMYLDALDMNSRLFAPFEAVKMTDMIIKGTFSKPMVRWQYVTT
jgi:hypothetical protein